jgi:hypothetical protein
MEHLDNWMTLAVYLKLPKLRRSRLYPALDQQSPEDGFRGVAKLHGGPATCYFMVNVSPTGKPFLVKAD